MTERAPARWWQCGKDWSRGFDAYVIGLWWDPDPEPIEGQEVYRRWLAVRWRWRFTLRWDWPGRHP